MSPGRNSLLDALIRFCVEQKLVVGLLLAAAVVGGLAFAPFDWDLGPLPRDPVPVDAIPDLGENQQIVFTEWPGSSPQDVEDQVTYPLTTALLGLPDVRTVRSYSFLGFSTVYVIFEERADFYDSRSRILEKLSSLPSGALPPGVRPALGPDATALGQIFWYTIEGRDAAGNPAGGWDPDELRSVQDWQVRYALLSAEGVAEVASVGGFVREYQVDVDPDALRAHGVGLMDVVRAVRESNADIGARTLEINNVEYVVRGVGFVESLTDIATAVVTVRDNLPVTVGDVATVAVGPALRRGVLDKGGAEAVGGVVVVRYGENPLQAIKNVKAKIAEIAPGLPRRTLDDGSVSQLTIVPFYDRTGLIHETLGTLNTALVDEILVTIIVVLVLIANLRGGLLVAGLLPLAVLLSFVAMKLFRVDANIVALSGIAIAIGTMVDMGIILTENILRRLDEAGPHDDRRQAVLTGAGEVATAVVAAVTTTILGFLPVFTLQAAEGKLFRPLAMTKTFALVAAALLALTVIPAVADLLLRRRRGRPTAGRARVNRLFHILSVVLIASVLAGHWRPLGFERGLPANLLFVALALGGVLLLFLFFRDVYPRALRWCLGHKAAFLLLPALLLIGGVFVWRGLGREFMPPLDEGSFLYMPTTMSHAGLGEAQDVLAKLDMAIAAVPEVSTAVGKLGRAESALDPAPVSMVETVVDYRTEYVEDESGRVRRFRFDRDRGEFVRDAAGALVPDEHGRPFRQWRDHIRSPDDIWDEIVAAAKLPGTTAAPRLQPISARLVMLQSGMRAPMGVKVRGPDLETIDRVALRIEQLLKEVPEVSAPAVIADRTVGKPYLEIVLDREAIARYGLTVRRVQDVLEVAVGGRPLTTTVEGRERYPVRVRFARERRDSIEELMRLPVTAPDGSQPPLGQLAELRYVRGPQAIKSENTFLVGYVLFDKRADVAEIDAVDAARARLAAAVASGELELPAGVSYAFAGNFENQMRAAARLGLVIPAVLLAIFLVLYFQFRAVTTALMVFSGIFVAWAGGFLMIWLYGQPWFLDAAPFGVDLRQLFQIHPINLSVAVWVGFIALFGIASDDGVLMATYLDQSFALRRPTTAAEVRDAVVAAASRRIRPAVMTTATTVLALLPVLTASGRGADIMIPMAIPVFGGMVMALLTVFIVPTLYAAVAEFRLRRGGN